MRGTIWVSGIALGLALLLICSNTARAVNWDESVNGDLSSDPNNPTVLGPFGAGIHSITATSSGGEQDDFTFSIAPGLALNSIVPKSYNSPLGDNTAFIGIASGTSIPNQSFAPGNLLGYSHFGPNIGNVGNNILADMGTGSGAIGFVPPLGPGNYSIWMQQAGSPATFTFSFTVVPEPASLGAMALGALVVRANRRRRW